MREGGDKYQSAYYVFEELAQGAGSQSVHMLVAQAVSELHMGRLPEAEAALGQAGKLGQEVGGGKGEEQQLDADYLANAVVLNTLLGREGERSELLVKLRGVDCNHPLVRGLEEKRSEFVKAAERWTPKVKA